MEKQELDGHFSAITDQLKSITTSLSGLNSRVTVLENPSGIGPADPSTSVINNSQFPRQVFEDLLRAGEQVIC